MFFQRIVMLEASFFNTSTLFDNKKDRSTPAQAAGQG
jgi:hypothetical protein